MSRLINHTFSEPNSTCTVCGLDYFDYSDSHPGFRLGVDELPHCLIEVEPIYTFEYKITRCMQKDSLRDARCILQNYADAGVSQWDLETRIERMRITITGISEAENDFLLDLLDIALNHCSRTWKIKYHE